MVTYFNTSKSLHLPARPSRAGDQILKNPLRLEHTFQKSFDIFLSDILLVIVERFNNMLPDCDFMMLKIYVLSSPCAIYINY